MFEDYSVNESLRGIWDKLASWLDSLILNLPNFILAIIVFLIFLLAAKYIGKLFDNLLSHKVKQNSIRSITVKIFKVIIVLIGFLLPLGFSTLTPFSHQSLPEPEL